MKLSAKCTTYGRVEYLQEALFSFINQDNLEDSQLVIVNDYPLQTLIFDHPNVKIFNLKETFPTIGDKDNFAVENSDGDVIITWDDDDLALPNHLNNVRKYFTPDTELLRWENAVFFNEPSKIDISQTGNSGMIYSKKAWLEVGKHPIYNAGGDSIFSGLLEKRGKVKWGNPPNEEISWFYRWGSIQDNNRNGIFHQSGAGTDSPDRENVIIRHSKHIESLRKQGRIPTGEIVLKPKWNQNYSQMLKDHLKKLK